MRLATVSVWVLTFIVIAAGIMLTPSYVRYTEEIRGKEEELATLSASLESAEEKQVGARLAQLEADVAHLNRLKELSTASTAIRAVLAVPHAGVVVEGVAFTPQKEGESHLVLTGTATTRDTLRRYNLALTSLPFVSKSDLPISAYAKETELPFTITLSGSFKP